MYEQLLHDAVKRGYNLGVCAKILNETGEVLLVKRALGDTYQHIWEMPGGSVESGESLEDALAREVQEETGLEVKRLVRYLGHFDSIISRQTRQKENFVLKY